MERKFLIFNLNVSTYMSMYMYMYVCMYMYIPDLMRAVSRMRLPEQNKIPVHTERREASYLYSNRKLAATSGHGILPALQQHSLLFRGQLHHGYWHVISMTA